MSFTDVVLHDLSTATNILLCACALLQLFFRAGTLAKLEEQRDKQTKQNLTLFQASCRGYLARQAFKKRKVCDCRRDSFRIPIPHRVYASQFTQDVEKTLVHQLKEKKRTGLL